MYVEKIEMSKFITWFFWYSQKLMFFFTEEFPMIIRVSNFVIILITRLIGVNYNYVNL